MFDRFLSISLHVCPKGLIVGCTWRSKNGVLIPELGISVKFRSQKCIILRYLLNDCCSFCHRNWGVHKKKGAVDRTPFEY